MSKYYHIIFGSFLLISAIFIFGGLIYNKELVEMNNDEYVEFRVDRNGDNGLSFDVTASDTWGDGNRPNLVFAQYDANFLNRTDYDFCDWTFELKFSYPCEISGLWNGDYTMPDQYTLIVTPYNYNYNVYANGGQAPFGFILSSEKLQKVEKFTAKGRFTKNWPDTKSFFVLHLCADCWFIFLLLYFLIWIKASSTNRRKQRDAAIILHSINTLVDFIEAKDEYTKGHSKRVASYTRKIARKMHLPRDIVDNYYYTALMHDCGKIGISDEILNKTSGLTDDEFNIIKGHTTIGSQMLSNFTDISNINLGALQHHERFDGTGYPYGLKGEEISQVARIIAVADSFDVMNCDRCYRKHISEDEIVKEFEQNRGSQFDPEIVDVFMELVYEGAISFD